MEILQNRQQNRRNDCYFVSVFGGPLANKDIVYVVWVLVQLSDLTFSGYEGTRSGCTHILAVALTHLLLFALLVFVNYGLSIVCDYLAWSHRTEDKGSVVAFETVNIGVAIMNSLLVKLPRSS